MRVKITYKAGVLVVTCNGGKAAEQTIKASDLKGRFGLYAHDVRLQIMNLKLRGQVDPNKL